MVVIPAREILPGVLAAVIKNAPLTPEKVAFAWRLAVGPEVGRATTVTLDGQGVLHVQAETPAWIAAVRKSTSLIHLRMNDLLGAGTVRTLHFDSGRT
ncbi:MAG: DciA family protein [Vicinamibacterales bacterium]